MNGGVYTKQELREKLSPIFRSYGIRRTWLFGSYARGDATENSDVDLIVDMENTKVLGLLALGGLYSDLETALRKPLDLVTLGTLNQKPRMPSDLVFRETVMQERASIYEQN